MGRLQRHHPSSAEHLFASQAPQSPRRLGGSGLRRIARELVQQVKANTAIDWTMRENVRAHLRVLVKRILRKYGYPPDLEEKATATVLEQAALLSAEWATLSTIG